MLIKDEKKYKIYLSYPHSKACSKLQQNNLDKSEIILDDYTQFKKEVFEYLNNLEFYDCKQCKINIEKIYNAKKYNFLLKKSTIINLINKWKDTSLLFTKYNALENPYDIENNQILRDHRILYKEDINSLRCKELEYFIWGNDLVISHLRKSENIFIDATFHTPIRFYQTLIIMFKDIITGEKYPGMYILTPYLPGVNNCYHLF